MINGTDVLFNFDKISKKRKKLKNNIDFFDVKIKCKIWINCCKTIYLYDIMSIQ